MPQKTVPALLLCSALRLNGEGSQRILELARRTPDWGTLLTAAREHGLTPIFCKNLEACAGGKLPSAWRQSLHQEFLANSCRNLAMTAELFRVLETFESHGVCATPYKGPVLAAQAWGDVTLRQFSDLDILVPQRDIAAAHGALLALGFRCVLPGLEAPADSRQIPGQYAYRREPEMLLELHTERTLRYFPQGLNLGELCERRELAKVAGKEVLTFSPEDTLLLISVHGSKHFWERLGWIADVAALVQASRPLDWRTVLERGRKWGVQRMVLLGAGLAERLFDAELPNQLAGCLKRDRVAWRLIEGICRRFLADEQVQLGVFRRFAFRARMRGPLAQGVPYAIRLAMMPTELDRKGRAPYLEPFHSLLRPLRLVRRYGWRTRVGP